MAEINFENYQPTIDPNEYTEAELNANNWKYENGTIVNPYGHIMKFPHQRFPNGFRFSDKRITLSIILNFISGLFGFSLIVIFEYIGIILYIFGVFLPNLIMFLLSATLLTHPFEYINEFAEYKSHPKKKIQKILSAITIFTCGLIPGFVNLILWINMDKEGTYAKSGKFKQLGYNQSNNFDSNISKGFMATPTNINKLNMIADAFLEDNPENDEDYLEDNTEYTQNSSQTTVQVQRPNINFKQSYIPKYIVKRFFPENGVARIQNGGLGITMKNVIAPGNSKVFGFYSIECISDRNTRRYGQDDPNLQIFYQGRSYDNMQFKNLNLPIPVGATVVIFLADFPNDNSSFCKLNLQTINPTNPTTGTTISIERRISTVQTLESLAMTRQ